MGSAPKTVQEMVSTLKAGISPSSLALISSALLLIYLLILRPIWYIHFHPLCKYPGPTLWAASALPWGFAFLRGNYHDKILDLHRQYGHTVRITPDELSYDIPEAWEDVYGRGTTRKENAKPTWYLHPKRNEIVGAREKDHSRMRRLLANGFTGAAMLEQEPLIRKNVNLLIQRLREVTDGGKTSVNMFEWFSYCTFDIIGDLAFGTSFGCLGDSTMRSWLNMVYANVKLVHNLILCNRLPVFLLFLPLMETWRLWKGSGEFERTVKGLIEKRLERQPERTDFVKIMEGRKGTSYMTHDELHSNAAFLTLAGSETTSTVMAVVVYMIGTRPAVKARLQEELRATFSCEDEINMRSAATLSYLMAVIEESMRIHPPGPNSLWRITPPEGNRILGDWIPGKTILGIPHRVMYRSEHNFKRPHEFIPERWLKDGEKAEFIDDRRDSFHPFSYGPRQCLAVKCVTLPYTSSLFEQSRSPLEVTDVGSLIRADNGCSLAYAEMRFILARMMWNFDFQIAEDSRDWADGLHSWLIWEKRPLHVYLKPKQKSDF